MEGSIAEEGTVSGTLDGATLTLRMNFPAGADVPTPLCATDLSGTAAFAGNHNSPAHTAALTAARASSRMAS